MSLFSGAIDFAGAVEEVGVQSIVKGEETNCKRVVA